MNLKLENQRQVIVHTVDVEADPDAPPDAVVWESRVYRYVRTDGLFDQKKHVYREATIVVVADPAVASGGADETVTELAQAQLHAEARARAEGARKLEVTLSARQTALLQRVRAQGGYPNFKATLIAGLDALDKGVTLNNEALLGLLAKRLRGARTDAA